jgi:hypothetical protein
VGVAVADVRADGAVDPGVVALDLVGDGELIARTRVAVAAEAGSLLVGPDEVQRGRWSLRCPGRGEQRRGGDGGEPGGERERSAVHDLLPFWVVAGVWLCMRCSASLSPAERSGRLVGRCAAIDLDKLRKSISSQSTGPGVDFSSGLALENFEG